MSTHTMFYYQQYVLVILMLSFSIQLTYADACDVETDYTLETNSSTQNFCALAQLSGGGCIPVSSDNQDSAAWEATVEEAVRCALDEVDNFDELDLSVEEPPAPKPLPSSQEPSLSPPQPPPLPNGTITANALNPNCQSQSCLYTLTAQPKIDYQFSHWVGEDPACQGDSNTIDVAHAGIANCAAIFHPIPPDLAHGEIVVTPLDADCVDNCQYQVSAQPATGYAWHNWKGSGACQGTRPELVLTSAAVTTCTASFIQQPTTATSPLPPVPSEVITIIDAPDTIIEGESGIVTLARQTGNTDEFVLPYITQADTAEAGTDYQYLAGEILWAHGDVSTKQITLITLPDSQQEGTETFTLLLSDAEATSITVNIADNTAAKEEDSNSPKPSPASCETAQTLYSSVPETVTLSMGEAPLDLFFVNIQDSLTLTMLPDTTLVNIKEVAFAAHPAQLQLDARAIGNTQLTVEDACHRMTINIQVVPNQPEACTAEPLTFTQTEPLRLAIGETKTLHAVGDIDPRYTDIANQTTHQDAATLMTGSNHNPSLGVHQFNFTGHSAGTMSWTLGNCHNTETVEIHVFDIQNPQDLLKYHCAHAKQATAICNSTNAVTYANYVPFIDNVWIELSNQSQDFSLNPVVTAQAELLIDLTIVAPLEQLGDTVEILFAVYNRNDNQYFHLSTDQWRPWDAENFSVLRGSKQSLAYLTQYTQNLPTQGLTSGQYQLYVAYRAKNGTIADNVAELSRFRISNSRAITTTVPPENSASTAWFSLKQNQHSFTCEIAPAMTHPEVSAILTVIGVEPPDLTTAVTYDGGVDVKYFVYNPTTEAFLLIDAYNTPSDKYPQGNWEAESAMLKQHALFTQGQLAIDLPFARLSGLNMPTPAAYYFFCGYFANDRLIFNAQPSILIK